MPQRTQMMSYTYDPKKYQNLISDFLFFSKKQNQKPKAKIEQTRIGRMNAHSRDFGEVAQQQAELWGISIPFVGKIKEVRKYLLYLRTDVRYSTPYSVQYSTLQLWNTVDW